MNIPETQYTSTTLPVMLLPLKTDNLMVPDAMVEEIVTAPVSPCETDSPDWYVGTVAWRGRSVPVIAFEALNGAMGAAASDIERVAIIKSMAEHGHLPYYAVALDGAASLVELSDDETFPHEGRPRGRAELMSIGVGEKTGGIPNTEWVEQHLLTYTLHS